MFGLRVDDGNGNAGQQAERDEALLTISKAVVLESELRALEDIRCVDEIEAVGISRWRRAWLPTN